jgi:hypothetical protein
MKLDKKTLKALIVESLEEMHGGEHTGTATSDVTSGRESEIQPAMTSEMSNKSLEDIAAFFNKELSILVDRIESSKPIEITGQMSEDDIRAAIRDMQQVQVNAKNVIDELEKIKLTLSSPKT